jgi:hypothetical protein
VTEGGSDPVGSKKFWSDPTRILSEFDGTWLKSDQIRPEFHRVPSNSDKNSVGFDRLFMKNVGFRWNSMRIRSKTTGSAGRIDSPGKVMHIHQVYTFNKNSSIYE